MSWNRGMPRLALVGLLLAAGAALAALGSDPREAARWLVRAEARAASVAAHGTRCALAAAVRLGAGTAHADDVFQFTPVPAESVSEFERRHARRRAESTAPPPPVAPAIPPSPDSLETPPLPLTPGKSGNITRLGSDIYIAPGQVVVGDVVALGGDVTVAGHVEGDVASMGGDVYLKSSARVDGDVVCMGGKLNEEPGASVGGQRVSGLGGRRARLHHATERAVHDVVEHETEVAASFTWLLILLALAWAFTRLGAGRTAAAVATLKREPGVSIGVGALVFALIIPSIVALAIVVAILCITIIGIPFALAALLAYMLFLCLLWSWGFVIAATVLGEAVLGRTAGAASLATGGLPPGAAPAPVAGAMPGAIGVSAPPPSLTKRAVVGILLLAGAGVLGRLFQLIGFFGPLHALGTLIHVLASIAGLVALTFGSGAWLRTELKAGTMARWWRGNQWSRGGGAPAAQPAPAASGVAPPPPPSAPSSFAPPGPAEPPPAAPV